MKAKINKAVARWARSSMAKVPNAQTCEGSTFFDVQAVSNCPSILPVMGKYQFVLIRLSYPISC